MDVVINGEVITLTPEEAENYIKPVLTELTVDSVSARQFKLQLLAAGMLDQVDAWVAQQSRATQISYEYSGSFVKESPMMAQGFAALGFTAEQVDAFFTAASKL